MKRYWVFKSYEYEAGVGLEDLEDMFETKAEALNVVKTAEWGAIFDYKTKMQTNFVRGKASLEPFAIGSF